ncbi:MAG: NAD-dependent epimerase/dehydratase family protein [Actinomycetota bacterium]|nr:NAD-dependent epimerase/dehydratase family protein [Actinomycetota bacterium]
MRVLVTGGTGFVGSHSVAALLGAGHEVRLLVRDSARVERALGPLNVSVSDVVVGDMTDPEAIAKAVQGRDAVVHAAALFTFDPRRIANIGATNVRGTEVVLEAACKAGCDPVVHVSSFAALLPQNEALTADGPVGTIHTPYSRSKAESDRVARRWQDEGAPVVITYPGAVMGANDPHMGESARLIASILRGQVPFQLNGVLPIADVRYVAAGHAAVMEPGRGSRRYLLTGIDTPGGELAAALRRVTGRRLIALPSPQVMTLAAARLADMLQRIAPVRLPLSYEPPYILKSMPRAGTDQSRTRAELGVSPPRLDDTLRDTVEWLVAAGHLPAKAAGRLAAP